MEFPAVVRNTTNTIISELTKKWQSFSYRTRVIAQVIAAVAAVFIALKVVVNCVYGKKRPILSAGNLKAKESSKPSAELPKPPAELPMISANVKKFIFHDSIWETIIYGDKVDVDICVKSLESELIFKTVESCDIPKVNAVIAEGKRVLANWGVIVPNDYNVIHGEDVKAIGARAARFTSWLNNNEVTEENIQAVKNALDLANKSLENLKKSRRKIA